MEEFSALGAEMARLAGRLGTIDPAAADRASLEWMVSTGPRLDAFSAARVALATVHLERLIAQEFATGSANPSANDPGPASNGTADDARADDASRGASASGDASADGRDRASGQFPPGSSGGRGESAEELERRLRRAKWLQHCPLFAAALEAGTITAEHVDILARAMEGIEPTVRSDVLADEAALVEVARRMARSAFGRYLRDVIDRVRADGGASRFERQLRNAFAAFRHDDDTGMYQLFCRVDPIRGAAMYAAVQARVDAMYQTKGATDGLSPGQVVLQAVHDLICREPADTDSGGGGVEIVVVCDCQTMTSGEHPHTICETNEGIRLPVSAVRDLCAEARITVAVAGADGRVLSAGSAERLATHEQRLVLRAMYRGCAHPGCKVPFLRCRIHHVLPWQQQGPTDVANLLPLCFEHHHLVHEGGWRLTIDPDRTLHWYRPNGELAATTPFEPLLDPNRSRTEAPTAGTDDPAARSNPGHEPSAPRATADEARERLRRLQTGVHGLDTPMRPPPATGPEPDGVLGAGDRLPDERHAAVPLRLFDEPAA